MIRCMIKILIALWAIYYLIYNNTSSAIGRRTYNCINIPQCPLQQKCLSNNILYQANITPIGENSKTKVYYGICETTFKLRYTNHKTSFNHRNRKSDT